MQKNIGKSVKKAKHQKGFGNMIFKSKNRKFHKTVNAERETKTTLQVNNQVEENKSDNVEEDRPTSSKYSSGKFNGMELCIKCGVGYRYCVYTIMIYLPILFY